MAVFSATANFVFIPYYSIWSILLIALDMAVIWALVFHGRDMTEGKMASRGFSGKEAKGGLR